jgi:uncharacterized protein (TIGR02246 family)
VPTPDPLDKLEIAELVARYSHAVNDVDFAAWADCFTPDGVFVGAYERFRAHDDLERFAATSRTLMESWPNLRLQFTDVLSTVGDDEATCRSNLVMTSTNADHEARVVFLAHYQDRLVRHDGRWLFAERIVRVAGR